jgi:hypothetical protein
MRQLSRESLHERQLPSPYESTMGGLFGKWTGKTWNERGRVGRVEGCWGVGGC